MWIAATLAVVLLGSGSAGWAEPAGRPGAGADSLGAGADSLDFGGPDSLELAQPDSLSPEASPADTTPGAFGELVFEEVPEDASLPRAEQVGEGAFYQPDISFNRVDGWTLGARFGSRPADGWFPRFEVSAASARHRHPSGRYSLEFAQPVLPGRRLLLGGQVRRATDDEDESRSGAIENFLSAFFFRYDYRDYFARSGVALFAEAHALPWLAVSATYADHRYGSLAEPAPDAGTAFRHDSPWRDNPAIDEGRMRSAIVGVVLDGRDNPFAPRRGAWLRLESEASGPGLESDFTFTRHQAEARGYWPLTLGMTVKARLLFGTTSAGTLPVQKQFAVGGISTLRAHSYKHHRGDQVFLANVEYGVLLWRGRQRSGVRTDVRALAFADLGQAWQGRTYDLARQQMMFDAGLGLGLADGRLRVYAARDLRDSGSATLWTVRLANPF
jgi:outer membrane protein assembly factor BamA